MRSYSSRFLQFLNLTTSKMLQFCETSSVFELDNIKNKAILRDILKFRSWQHQKRSTSARLPFENRALGAEPTASYQCGLRFFQTSACQEKVMPGSTKCCTCHAKSPQQTLRSDAPGKAVGAVGELVGVRSSSHFRKEETNENATP